MCFICGADNRYGLRAPFYNMQDGSCVTRFSYGKEHQSFPGRVHGGLISAMIDELGLRALWSSEDESKFGVTFGLETSYRKPVPYDEELLASGIVVKSTPRFFVVESKIFSSDGELLASGTVRYLRLDTSQIAKGINYHDEMMMIKDDVTEIDIPV